MDTNMMENHTQNHTENSENSNAANDIVLYVKCGSKDDVNGACPVCQRIFMILLTKEMVGGEIKFQVVPIDLARAAETFQKQISRLPALMDGDEIIQDPDEIIQHIHKKFHYPPMAYDNVRAAEACRDIFSKFSFYVNNVSESSVPLQAALRKLNDYLEESENKFLTRDIPDHLDCMTLPKLQHIRVAAKVLKGFDIPHEFRGVWRYLRTAYSSPIFSNSCPSDQGIVHHWVTKLKYAALDKEQLKIHSTDLPARHSFTVPEGLEIRD